MPRIPALLMAALAPLAVAGCFPNPNYSDMPDEHVIGRRTDVFGALAVADIKAPTESERAQITSWLAAAGEKGLRIRVQLGRAQAQTPELELRQALADLGVQPGTAVVERTGTEEQTKLVFERTVLTAPDCDQMITPNEAFDFGHATYSAPRPVMSFGCATYTNLSRQIADPADLETPRALGTADAPTSAAAIQRYHDNTVTPLRKTTSVKNSGGSK